MRRLWIQLFGALTVGLLAMGTTQAQGAALPFTGAFSLQIGIDTGFKPLPPSVVTGSGTAALTTAGAHLDSLDLPASPFNAVGLVTPTHFISGPWKGVVLTVHNGAGAFGGVPLGGVMPLHGVAKVCLRTSCSIATANISIPLSLVGVGGTAAYPPGATSASVNVTVRGAPWTAGTAAAGSLTQMGFVHGPASGSSSTAAGSGAIQLVTPIFISTNTGPPAFPAFGILDLHFVPEPGTLLLLGGGIAGLVLLGRSKRD
jgi:hypothetical protein